MSTKGKILVCFNQNMIEREPILVLDCYLRLPHIVVFETKLNQWNQVKLKQNKKAKQNKGKQVNPWNQFKTKENIYKTNKNKSKQFPSWSFKWL